MARSRWALSALLLPRAADGRIVLAVGVSPWLRTSWTAVLDAVRLGPKTTSVRADGVDDKDPVQNLAAHAAGPAFHDGVHPGRLSSLSPSVSFSACRRCPRYELNPAHATCVPRQEAQPTLEPTDSSALLSPRLCQPWQSLA